MVQVEEAVVLSYCDALVAGEDALLADAGVQSKPFTDSNTFFLGHWLLLSCKLRDILKQLLPGSALVPDCKEHLNSENQNLYTHTREHTCRKAQETPRRQENCKRHSNAKIIILTKIDLFSF